MSTRVGLRSLVVGSVVVLTLLMGVAPTMAQATTVRDRFTVPFVLDDINPCTGEPVVIAGELHITERVTIDAQGGLHFTYSLVPDNVRGVGASGAVYKAVGGARAHFNLTAGGSLNDTYTNTFNLISQGDGDNFVEHVTFHVTITPDGVVTVVVDNFRAECRG